MRDIWFTHQISRIFIYSEPMKPLCSYAAECFGVKESHLITQVGFFQ